MNRLLFIGLNGYAGSGKDTVAKMLKTILEKNWTSLDECKAYYNSIYINPTISATYNKIAPYTRDSKVMCIAYADQLKYICSSIFGIPLERFYMNKSTGWICINDKFQYTETKPEDDHIFTAEEYYCNINEFTPDNKAWLSLREILVYVGTYVLQNDINKSIFINIIRNKIREELMYNQNLSYVIVTDNRFIRELDYIRENNGITMTIVRDSITQLDNIAEHELDYEEDYDYVVNNSTSYDDLFQQIWDIVHNDIEFKNITIDLYTRDTSQNYLRLISETPFETKFKLCTQSRIQKMFKNELGISVIDPTGGPMISLGSPIQCIGTQKTYIPSRILMNENTKQFFIVCDND